MTTIIVVRGATIHEQELSSVFGRGPTSVWQTPPKVAAKQPQLTAQEWRYELREQLHLSFSAAVDELFAEFAARFDLVAEYCRSHSLSVSIHLHPKGSERDFVLGFDRPETLHAVARLNATVYLHPEELIIG